MKILIAVVSLMSTFAFAALPPLYESIHEIKAAVKAPAVEQNLPEAIVGITANTEAVLITTDNCYVIAKLETLPSKPTLAGPREFKVSVGNVTCGKGAAKADKKVVAKSIKSISALLEANLSDELDMAVVRTLTVQDKGIVISTEGCTVSAEETSAGTFKLSKAVCLKNKH